MSAVKYWLWLTTRGQMPGMFAAKLLEHFGTPERAYFAGEAECEAVETVPKSVREALQDKDLSHVETILNDCETLNIRILTIQDTEYPERLRQLNDAPVVLYVRGNLPRMDEEAAIAVVGARDATPYGTLTAEKLGLGLAQQGAVVVSGSARGVDSAALRGALKGGGRVVSVLGNGIDVIYPWNNGDLYDDVAAAGALVSEFPPGTPPEGKNFPIRNRIIAGLSLGVTVVEGTMRSGSLITARWALEQDRDVFAVPGNIDAPMSRGPNQLIRRNEARLITDAREILEEYEHLFPAKLRPKAPLSPETEEARLNAGRKPPEEPKRRKAPPKEEPKPEENRLVIDLTQAPDSLTDDEAAVLRALQGEIQCTADDLVERTGLPARRILSALTLLQVRQLVTEDTGKRFSTAVVLKE